MRLRTVNMSLTKKLAITDVDVKDKRVLIRVSNGNRSNFDWRDEY